MKKLMFIFALFLVTFLIQSCCVTASCPGLAQIEVSQIDS